MTYSRAYPAAFGEKIAEYFTEMDLLPKLDRASKDFLALADRHEKVVTPNPLCTVSGRINSHVQQIQIVGMITWAL